MSRKPSHERELPEVVDAPAPPSERRATPELYLRYSFEDTSLLRTALTHSSRAHERSSGQSSPSLDNERLEFLGDAVLNLVSAQALLEEFVDAEEGQLTRLRSSIVSQDHLVRVARRMQLGKYLFLGRGEDRSGGRHKPAILADALEAIIAALYLDGGLPAAASFIRREVVDPELPALRKALEQRVPLGDHKTALQEMLQANGQVPRYVPLEESGPDHQRSFRVAVEVQGADGNTRRLADAYGTTKKQAQQRAAHGALQQLSSRDEASPEVTPSL